MSKTIRPTNDEKNKAIVDKVAKILASTDYRSEMSICISEKQAELLTVRYCITEYIVPDGTGEE